MASAAARLFIERTKQSSRSVQNADSSTDIGGGRAHGSGDAQKVVSEAWSVTSAVPR